MEVILSTSQKKAIDHVASLSAIKSRTDDELLSSFKIIDTRRMAVTLNFHPDRLLPNGQLLLEAMAKDDLYASQFVTGTSNGGLSAFPGGKRWEWESRIFGRAYDEVPGSERPVYGGLNYLHKPVGASPRFGSAHFRLRPHMLVRTTFCYPDSVYEPTDFAVAAVHPCDIETVSNNRFADVSESCRRLISLAVADYSEGSTRDPLDDYIEAHIHGPVVVSRDIEALVLDPCYRGTEVEEAAKKLPCPIEWHAGYRLSVDVMKQYPHYRGQQFVDLGSVLARDSYIDPLIVGEAVRVPHNDPQDIKKVWHYLAHFGYSDDLVDN